MSKELPPIKERKHTDIIVRPEEVNETIQLYGKWQDDKTEENWKKHEEYFKDLCKRYKIEPWDRHEIAPNGEFIRVIREGDE